MMSKKLNAEVILICEVDSPALGRSDAGNIRVRKHRFIFFRLIIGPAAPVLHRWHLRESR